MSHSSFGQFLASHAHVCAAVKPVAKKSHCTIVSRFSYRKSRIHTGWLPCGRQETTAFLTFPHHRCFVRNTAFFPKSLDRNWRKTKIEHSSCTCFQWLHLSGCCLPFPFPTSQRSFLLPCCVFVSNFSFQKGFISDNKTHASFRGKITTDEEKQEPYTHGGVFFRWVGAVWAARDHMFWCSLSTQNLKWPFLVVVENMVVSIQKGCLHTGTFLSSRESFACMKLDECKIPFSLKNVKQRQHSTLRQNRKYTGTGENAFAEMTRPIAEANFIIGGRKLQVRHALTQLIKQFQTEKKLQSCQDVSVFLETRVHVAWECFSARDLMKWDTRIQLCWKKDQWW